MKKSDLKDGMIVELNYGKMGIILNNSIRYNVGFDRLNIFDDNLRFEDVTIDRIYEVTNDCCSIKEVLNKDNLTLMWERKKEIDWSKVPFGIKVFVCDYPLSEEEIKNKCFHDDEEPYEFICYRDEIKKFIVFDREYNEVYSFKYCYFHKSVKIKEEWYKE